MIFIPGQLLQFLYNTEQQRDNVQQQQLPARLEPLPSSWTAAQCSTQPPPSWASSTSSAWGPRLHSHRKLPLPVPYPGDSGPCVGALGLLCGRGCRPGVRGQLAALCPHHHALGQSRHAALHGAEHDVAVPSCLHYAHVSWHWASWVL